MPNVLTKQQQVKPAVLAAITAAIEAYSTAEKKDYRIHTIQRSESISLWKIAGLLESMSVRDFNRDLL
ncbi:MAG: hypothetical protein C4589_10015 [Peptococcaceae bacterium]|nr:MAG: hypothetical protein C4589_10015 [Peptococcaceae bacterium]